ncbi:hypothetical protein NMG60_11004123 [Bertholletia excelsa]
MKMMMKGLLIQQQKPAVEENMSNLTSASGEASASSGNRAETGTNIDYPQQHLAPPTQTQPVAKKKRSLPGNPDPDAEVIALSPKTLLATNRFVCEICNKGFQRDQNLQLHRRGHNLPWKLKQRTNKEMRKKVYVCPEPGCVHHDPSRALGDLTGIKKHFCRKHGEKKWKCEKCSKKYAVQSDWKAHSKTCGTREYRCDCGTLFSRRDSFITHRAFCDALAEESARAIIATTTTNPLIVSSQAAPNPNIHFQAHDLHAFATKKEQQNYSNSPRPPEVPAWLAFPQPDDLTPSSSSNILGFTHGQNPNPNSSLGPTLQSYHQSSPHMSATALLQKAAQMGSTISGFGHGSARVDVADHVQPATATGIIQQHPSFLQDMMVTSLSSASGFVSSAYEDGISGDFLSSTKREENFHSNHSKTILPFTSNNRGGAGAAAGAGAGSDGMTRDFLGLSHGDIFSIAGLSDQTQKPWQG